MRILACRGEEAKDICSDIRNADGDKISDQDQDQDQKLSACRVVTRNYCTEAGADLRFGQGGGPNPKPHFI
jgi:hypothetical protein